MQLKNHNFFFLVLMTASFLFACNDADDTTEIKASDTTTAVTSNANTNTTSMPSYDAALDPLTVEAAFIKKLGDTLNVKMYELTIKPGDSAALHTHPDFTMYVLQGGKLAITPQGADR
ncbi:MAG TPA: hypothetical protein VNA26_03020, partial [Chitinophagaceae bacterium]|nr:hypothetical protein [Chitinophagaceae bacterium]